MNNVGHILKIKLSGISYGSNRGIDKYLYSSENEDDTVATPFQGILRRPILEKREFDTLPDLLGHLSTTGDELRRCALELAFKERKINVDDSASSDSSEDTSDEDEAYSDSETDRDGKRKITGVVRDWHRSRKQLGLSDELENNNVR